MVNRHIDTLVVYRGDKWGLPIGHAMWGWFSSAW